MSREIKFGLLLVVGLTSVFGFMVYKKLHQPADLAADTAAEKPGDEDASPATAPALTISDGDTAGVVTAEGTTDSTAASPGGGATQVLTVGEVKAAPAASPSRPASASKHPLLEEDPFSADVKPVPQPVRTSPPNPANEPFAPQPVRISTSRSAPAAAPASDPFASEAVTTPAASSVKQPAPQGLQFGAPAPTPNSRGKLPPATSVEADPFAAELATPKSAPVLSRPAATDDPFAAPRSVKLPSATNEATATSTTVIERRSSPVQLELDLSEPVARPAAGLLAKPIGMSGPAYVIQPNDNYWTISKKVYGTGRYFQALLKHNEQVIPDPQRMRPGMEIATPAVADLEARYPELISDQSAPKSTPPVAFAPGEAFIAESGDNFWTISKKVYGTGRFFQALAEHNKATIPDPLKLRAGTPVQTPAANELQSRYAALLMESGSKAVVAASTTSPSVTGDDASGFFVGPNDQPQYRVGPEDTLSGIARAHLGRSSRWVQVLEMNRDVLIDGNTLKVGTVLRLPADASQVQAVGFDRNGR